jgi:hypothetical protein
MSKDIKHEREISRRNRFLMVRGVAGGTLRSIHGRPITTTKALHDMKFNVEGRIADVSWLKGLSRSTPVWDRMFGDREDR